MNETKFRVAVCGGGIGGLTCALALSQYPNIEVDIYEAANKFADVGAGFGVWPRAWRILKTLGLEPDLIKITETPPKDGPVPFFTYRKSDQPEGCNFYTLVTIGGLRTFYRPAFQKVLLAKLPKSCKTHCSKRLRGYMEPPSGPIQLTFEDGSTSTCDVLVGADGVNSQVRSCLMRDRATKAQAEGRIKERDESLASTDPYWSGTIAYRALISVERLKVLAPGHRAITTPTQYLGKNGYLLVYPISQGKFLNFVAFKARHDLENTPFNKGPCVSPTVKDEFMGIFSQWEPEVRTLLSVIETPTKWPIQIVKPLKSFVSRRVALIGDAAHAMLPHQGAGAGQSIEDAYLLATLLGHQRTTLDFIPRTLKIYDAIRRPFTKQISEGSRLNGQYFTFHGVDYDDVSPDKVQARLLRLGNAVTRNWEWAWTSTLDEALEEAIRMLENSRR